MPKLYKNTNKFAISIHPGAVDLESARRSHIYGSLWGRGFRVARFDTMTQLGMFICKHVWSPIIWNHGIRRKVNWYGAQFMVLDFDSPEYTVAMAQADWVDAQHIIATTKSHQIEKKGVTCDRFRLVVPWTNAIKISSDYVYSLSRISNRYGADPKCCDVVDYFYPCVDIISINETGYTQAHEQRPINPYAQSLHSTKFPKSSLDKYVWNFVNHGKLPVWEKSRNWMVFICAYTQDEIYGLLKDAPFDRTGFSPDLVMKKILSAWRHLYGTAEPHLSNR